MQPLALSYARDTRTQMHRPKGEEGCSSTNKTFAVKKKATARDDGLILESNIK